jgi:hypothetical protein
MKMEQEIINRALEALNLTTGIQTLFKHQETLDGELEMILNGHKHQFLIKVKKELGTHQLPQIVEFHKSHDNFLLIANRLNSKVKKDLREIGIPYIEANGNVFVKKDGNFLLVDTQKALEIEKVKGNRAFTKTGLKVVFYLLQHKEAINLPQREIAALTNVALGNIPQVLDGLKETGYLIPLKSKTFVWENREALLYRWIEEYKTELRPRLIKERYSLKQKWEQIKFDHRKTDWGGDPAADLITHHLRPERFLIYTTENRLDLIKNHHFMPNKNGEVEVLEMFWKDNQSETAPKLLVYADLILEGGKRNKETADKIYEEYIKSIL